MALGDEAPPTCPVCGAPEMSCGPLDGSSGKPHHVAFVEWSEEYRPPPERTPTMADVVATERIFENVRIPRTKDRVRKVLRFTPGMAVPGDQAKALGVDKKGRQKKVPTNDDQAGLVPLSQKNGGR